MSGQVKKGKPPYIIPSMKEINKIPYNGYNVVSTFSGGGGSSLGYRMAGFKVLWANEFIPAAQDTYRKNFPNTFLNPNDIRTITADQIREEAGVDEIDVLDGSPPCASFSTSGLRDKAWGEEKPYSDTVQRVDDLFDEYVRILGDLQPKVFIAENVAGLVSGVSKGYFKKILREMKSKGYKVEARELDAQWLGVPQRRRRIIFMGVRNDLNRTPLYPTPFQYNYAFKEVLPREGLDGDHWVLPEGEMRNIYFAARSMKGAKGRFNDASRKLFGAPKYFSHYVAQWDIPCPTIIQGSTGIYHPLYPRSLTTPECRVLTSLPEDFILTGPFRKQWERIARMVPPIMMKHIALKVKEVLDGCDS